MAKPTYIQFFFDDLDALESLGDAERGRLLTSLLEYGKTGVTEKLGGNERFLFPMFKGRVDRFFQAYDESCKKNKSNVEKRYTKPTTVYGGRGGIRKLPSEEEEEEEKEEENISPLPPSGEKEKQKDLFAEFANGDTKLLAALTAFDQMRTRIKKPMTDRAKELLLAKLQTFPSRDWTAILDQSVMSCWQGIFPLGGDKAQRTASEPKTFTELLQEAQHGY
jgi:hypothetical protein